MLNSDYFTIHPAQDRSPSRVSTRDGSTSIKLSFGQAARSEMEEDFSTDVHDIGSLIKALRFSRIDREKMEAVENFTKNGGDELYYLRENMHEIMSQFIFQASRRLVLAHLNKIFDEASDYKKDEDETEIEPSKKRRLDNLQAAVKAADEEVKRLEFWSDVKDMAEKGETKGAMDESQGWDNRWTGLDVSGPKDVISDREMPGNGDCHKGSESEPPEVGETRKGKAKE